MEDSVSGDIAAAWGRRLLALGYRVQTHVHELLCSDVEGLAVPVADESGDTIYELDRRVEHLIEAETSAWPAECFPMVVVAEGMGVDGITRLGHASEPARYRVLLDPIDGTRCLMYDKRSAWFIAAVAPESDRVSLRDVFASVLVELPTSKQWLCDSYVGIAGAPAQCLRTRVGGGDPVNLSIQPSQSDTLAGGFGHVVSFFQDTRHLAAELMQTIAEVVVPNHHSARTAIFDDQYISTGGQMAELISGRDRFCCDLRPLFLQHLHRATGVEPPPLVCHPYDAAALFIAEQSGVVITDGFGRPLDAPFDVHTPVHWCGYANRELASLISPIIVEWLTAHGIDPLPA